MFLNCTAVLVSLLTEFNLVRFLSVYFVMDLTLDYFVCVCVCLCIRVFAGKWLLRGTRAIRVGQLCVQSRSKECLHHGPQLRRTVFRWAGKCFSFPFLPPTDMKTHWYTQYTPVSTITLTHVHSGKSPYSISYTDYNLSLQCCDTYSSNTYTYTQPC